LEQQVRSEGPLSGSPAVPADVRHLQLRRGARLLEERAAGRPTLMEAGTSTRRRRFHMATFSFEHRPRNAHLRTCRSGHRSQRVKSRTPHLLPYRDSTSHTAFPTCCSCTHTLPLLTVSTPPPTLVAGLYRIFLFEPAFELWGYRVVLREMRVAISGFFLQQRSQSGARDAVRLDGVVWSDGDVTRWRPRVTFCAYFERLKSCMCFAYV